MNHLFRSEMRIHNPIDEVFPFFAEAANLESITPPELCFRIRTPLPIEMKEGTLIDYDLKLNGIPFRWTTRISDWNPPGRFRDIQIKGPYKQWIHTHSFTQEGDATRMTDEVAYQLPFWPTGELFLPLIRRKLKWIFDFREQAIRRYFKDKTLPLE